MDAAGDDQRLAQSPVPDRLLEVGLGRVGDVDGGLGGPISRGAMTLVRWSIRTVLTRQVDLGVDGVAVEVEQRAELEDDALLDLVGPGLEGDAAAGVLGPARRRRSAVSMLRWIGLAVDHLDALLGELAEPLLDLHLGEHQGGVAGVHGPDLLALRAAADVGQPRVDRVPPARVDRGDVLDVDLQRVVGGRW